MQWLIRELQKQQITKGFDNPSLQYAHLTPIQEASVLYQRIQEKKQPILVIKENETQARQLLQQLENLYSDVHIVFYQQEESLRIEAIASSPETHYEKMESLYQILFEEVDIIITTIQSTLRYLTNPDYLKAISKEIKVDDEIKMSELVETLVRLGYAQVSVVEKPFTFSRRGGLIDIFTIQQAHPVRIDFFDDVIESIRTFDITTQRSIRSQTSIRLFASSEYLIDDDQKQIFLKKANQVLAKFSEQLEANHYEILLEQLQPEIDRFVINQVESKDYPLFMLSEPKHTLFDYCPNAQVVISSHPAVKKAAAFFIEESTDYLIEMHTIHKGLGRYDLFNSYENILKRNPLLFNQFQVDQVGQEIDVDIHELFNPQLELDQLINHLTKQAMDHRVVLSISSKQTENLIKKLNDIPYIMLDNNLEKPGIYIQEIPLENGFFITNSKIQVYSSKELFNKVVRKGRYERQFALAESLSGIADLKKGDYVVHRQYGVGQYLGLVTQSVNYHQKDFIKIAYRGDDVLLVPLEQFKLIRKFVSSEGLGVKLNKLGTSEWKKTKDRIKDSVNDIADQLIELYKKREASIGFSFSADNEYMHQFEDEFPYTLTHDQVVAISEVKKDMEASQPMDRLLSGDVGFGKTEVAIRAAFKAVLDQKQVAILCPTTVLSQQHYRTFMDRFKNWPVSIGILNRYVSVADQKKTIEKLRKGQIDIIIGTHRILSKDLKFKDLGLLVIDEEQRFGVEQKERIKSIKTNVDVLSLSATPIPRTLQMSLVGIRSLSQLNTPPSNRLPVVTRIIEKNPKLIEDLVEKELARKGQVFYLYNNVQEIYNVAYKLQQRFPDTVVACAHGQMDREEIENVMMAFTRNEIQVLVCTTIVETGIDIPNANTMLIDQADRFGLAQLYQIKGRVGRSDRLAYAYLMVDPQKQLTEIATKRLEAIKEFTQLGSGYKIAMRDLTIRGAGEILGGNQSGFIDTVGIDLYIELLQEALALKQGQTIEEPSRPLNLDIDSYIPQEYTSDESLKIELYQKIDRISSMDALHRFYQESEDRYGRFPSSVKMLLEKKQLELMLGDPRIEDFKDNAKQVTIIFTKAYSDQVDGVALFGKVNEISKDIKLKYLQGKIRLELDKERGWLSELVALLVALKGA